MATSDPASTARLEAARAGDALAWSHLYHELAPLVLGYLRGQRLPDAEDVAGEVMLEVVRDLGRFAGDAAGLRSWVLSVAHHRLLDARRRAQRRPVTAAAPAPESHHVATEIGPEESTIASEGLARLQPALAALTEDQRTVLLLRVVGDLSIADVARITGKRPGAVKQLQRRAAASMRRTLDEGARGERIEVVRDPDPVPRRRPGALVPVDGHPDGG
ncbi:MAG: RNA polymerase sigma factor [Nitriliruptoraceae bacterium]